MILRAFLIQFLGFFFGKVTQVDSSMVLFVFLLSSTTVIQDHHGKEISPAKIAGGSPIYPPTTQGEMIIIHTSKQLLKK